MSQGLNETIINPAIEAVAPFVANFETRDYVERAVISRGALIIHVRGRYATERHVDVDTDILIRRIALSLKAQYSATVSKSSTVASDFDDDALRIIGKKTLTKTCIVDDNTRSQSEQDVYHAANVWLNRLKSDAGVKALKADGTAEKRGGARTPDTKEAAPTPIVAAPTAPVEPLRFEVPKVSLPKPKATADVGELISMLSGMASKLLAENAASEALMGDAGMIARDALTAIAGVASGYKARILALEAKSPDAPKGKRREAVIALAKRMDKAPVAELAN